MGKAADNEKHKMRANFYNNLSVGCVIAGLVAPYVTFIAKGVEQKITFARILVVFVDENPEGAIMLAVTIATAFLLAVLCRMHANDQLSKIVD